MSLKLLPSDEAAHRLGIQVSTLYDWLAQSDGGRLVIRGQQVTIEYYQAGKKGQGRIKIAADEIERLISLMRVAPQSKGPSRRPTPRKGLQHIRTKLGRPDD